MTCRPSSVSALRAGAPCKKLRPLALTLQLAFAGSLIAGAGWGAASAHAQPTPTAASASRAYQIPAGPLSAVLTRFCTEAGVFLAGSTELTQGRRSAGLRGSYTPEAGIKVLLAGTGLEAVRQDNGSYALRSAAVSETTASAAASSAQTLPVVMVHAPRETATGPATGYQATQSATATKTDTALMDTPASLSIVTQAQIEAQATRTTGEALRYSAGVAAEFDGVDSRFDTIAIRGFNAGSTTWLDGTKLEGGLGAGNNWTLPQIDPFALERIELLKGPASVLYGQVIPGGMLNMVSKRPDTAVQRNVELTVGSHGQHRAGIDLGGPLGESGAAWRLVGLGSETGSQVDFAQRRRLLLAPSIKLPLGGRGDVTLLASVQRDRGGSDYTWLPAYGTLRPNPNGPIPSSRFIGEPAFNRYDRDQDLFGWSLQYALTDALTLRQNVRAQRLTSVLEAVNSDMYAWDDPAETQDWDWRTLDRYATRGVGKARALGADTQLQWKGSTASVQHTVLAGVDHYRNTFTAQRSAADMADGAGALDLYAPVYGAAIGAFTPLSSIDSRTRQTGLYLQDQLQWGPWRAIAGLRHDRSDVEGSSMRRNQVSDLEQKDSATTARLGLLYRTDSGWAPYASYATSFEPVAGVTAQGAPFKPMKGRQAEVGAKYQPSGAAWNATFAVFDLRQTNRLTDDPVNGWPEQVQTGEVRTRGLELELRGRLSRNWALIGGFTHLNTRVTRSEIPEELGQPMLFVPRNQASLWLDYTVIGAGPLSGAVLGAGARHVGASRGGDIGVAGGGYASLSVPSHTVFDLRAALQLRRLWPQLGDSELALNISNLTNRRYVNGCGSLWTCGLGLERQVSLSFVGRF